MPAIHRWRMTISPGLTVATSLAQFLSGRDLRYSYRFLFIPGTIGAITWLARNRETAGRIRHGLVLTCIGDAGGSTIRRAAGEMPRLTAPRRMFSAITAIRSEILEFSPYGYDERQYCSPGFNLPVGCLMRSVWGSFPGVSHFGRQSRFHPAAAAGRIAARVRRHPGCAGKQSAVLQPEPLLRTATGTAKPLPLHGRRRDRRRRFLRVFGC